jgi:hypothetical protein
MTSREQKLKALEFFKDWSNYLLVTTVAAVGWVTSKDVLIQPWAKPLCVWAFAVSVVFAILTLAIIPRVAEKLRDDMTSMYDVAPEIQPALVLATNCASKTEGGLLAPARIVPHWNCSVRAWTWALTASSTRLNDIPLLSRNPLRLPPHKSPSMRPPRPREPHVKPLL